MGEHEHCAHFVSGGPNATRTEVCCQCGGFRVVLVTDKITEGHGPFIPSAESAKQVEYGEWVDPP
jgi:hypothetical protein